MARGQRSVDVEYSAVGDGLGMRDFCLYLWLRRLSVAAAHIASLGLVVLTCILARPGTSLFSWHPVCMSFGFSLCMTEGILLFSGEFSPLFLSSRHWKVRVHWFLQGLLLLCGGSGLCFMVASKNSMSHSHLSSWHSLLGLSSLVAVVLQSICGLVLLFPKTSSGRSYPRLRLYHATCGLLAYLLATLTLVSAMFTDWFQASVTGNAWYIFLFLPLLPALVVMNQISSAFLPKKKITS
ncbi:hypothetical protein DNTS_032983 [Danionella cerebrum]|uniref:ascorbate ferrireductase (transmembrane) n=1 Tax=Danionella cerebrum TaxID=2873325 RepID=A0A553QY39_9TELE|nr:hypothetical protein DNTS_032983 [Danionella translucida]